MNSADKKIRVRFAPSPTGFMHIGNFRSALYDYLFAKKHKGVFILRIEDTDRKRFMEGSLESLLKILQWAGLKYEGEPYVQSEHLDVYKKYAEQLVANGKAYYCFCEPQRLEEMREKQQQDKQPPMYDRYCVTNISVEDINQKLKENCPGVIRLKVPRGEEIVFEDAVRGKVTFNTDTIDDQVLLKSDGFPTYHLANVVDDHLMEISHVIRGEEWLPSTPKHILIYKAFGWEVPVFAHLPLLLNADKSKLSKRQGDVAVEDYIAKGYLKEAIINFVALLGWNPGEGSVQELFSMDELIEKFDLSHVHKAGAVFDLKKLDWINNQYIKKLSIGDLYSQALPFFEQKEWFAQLSDEKKSAAYLKKVLAVEQERLNMLDEVGEGNPHFFQDVDYAKEFLVWKSMTRDELKESLEKSLQTLGSIAEEEWTRENLEKNLLETAGDKRGDLLWPLRVALTGAQKSPSPFECAWVLGKKETLKRINDAISK